MLLDQGKWFSGMEIIAGAENADWISQTLVQKWKTGKMNGQMIRVKGQKGEQGETMEMIEVF